MALWQGWCSVNIGDGDGCGSILYAFIGSDKHEKNKPV